MSSAGKVLNGPSNGMRVGQGPRSASLTHTLFLARTAKSQRRSAARGGRRPPGARFRLDRSRKSGLPLRLAVELERKASRSHASAPKGGRDKPRAPAPRRRRPPSPPRGLGARSPPPRRAPPAPSRPGSVSLVALTHSRILMKPSGSLSGLRLIWKADIL